MGRVRIYQAIKPDGTALWPEQRPIEWLLEQQRMMPRVYFNAQYQNDPAGLRGVRYDIGWLQYYTDGQRPPLTDLVGIQTGDPATSERETSNYFGHCTAGKDPTTGIIYILGFAFGHIPATGHEEFLRAQYRSWTQRGLTIRNVVLEELGPIQAATQHLAVITRLHPEGPMPLEILKPPGSKEQRFDAMLPYLGNGTVLFPGRLGGGIVSIAENPGMDEFKREYTSFPKGGRDDVLDALWMAVNGLIETGMAASITGADVENQIEEEILAAASMDADEWVRMMWKKKYSQAGESEEELEEDEVLQENSRRQMFDHSPRRLFHRR